MAHALFPESGDREHYSSSPGQQSISNPGRVASTRAVGDGSEGALLDRVIAGSLAASSSSSSDDDRLAREGHGEALLSEHGELLRLDVIGVEI